MQPVVATTCMSMNSEAVGLGLFHLLKYLSLLDGNASHMFLMFMINGGLVMKQRLWKWQFLTNRLLDLLVLKVV